MLALHKLMARSAEAVEYPDYFVTAGKDSPPRVFWLWHKTIRWWGFNNEVAWGNVEYSFIAIASRPT